MVYDVIVIGAGAAGLAATRRLRQAGCQVLALEARDRIGGRIHTDRNFSAYPIELGAEFVHGQNVGTWELIHAGRLETAQVFAEEKQFFWSVDGAMRPAPEITQSHAGAAALRAMSLYGEGMNDAVARLRINHLPDTNVASLLQSLLVPADTEFSRMVEGSYQGLNAADPAELSALSLLEADYEGDGDHDFRISSGYDAWLHLLGSDLPVRLRTPVRGVRWHSKGVELTTQEGKTFAARRLIVTSPLAMLQQNIPLFVPALPPDKQQALRQLGAGPITKVFLRFDHPFWPAQMERATTGLHPRFLYRPRFGRRDEEPVLCVYVGASSARALNRLEPKAAVQVIVTDLRRAFGLAGAPQVVSWRLVDWSADPFAGMGYSFVRPGGIGARAALAAPVENVLFWAGEATNPMRPATVHGATESGIRAAEEVLQVGSFDR